jgi:hypothetical protein
MRTALPFLLLAFAAFPALGAASGGQAGVPAAVTSFDPGLLPPTVLFDEPGDGAIWALGTTYKAAFSTGGLTFIPFFGSHAPRNFPLVLSLESARVGEADLAVENPVHPVRDGNSVIFDRGMEPGGA